MLALSACAPSETIFEGFGADARKLRVVNREVTRLRDRDGVRLSSRSGNGIAWVEGSEFRFGSIAVDIHRQNDTTYDAVYLRPFNFRAADPSRRQHAVQYISLPTFDFQDLRHEFPEEFENPVDASLEPTGWVKLRVVVDRSKVQIHVGPGKDVTLEVRRLGHFGGGQVGLWVGNDSGGDFANLVLTSVK
jgi:hypothetical protein